MKRLGATHPLHRGLRHLPHARDGTWLLLSCYSIGHNSWLQNTAVRHVVVQYEENKDVTENVFSVWKGLQPHLSHQVVSILVPSLICHPLTFDKVWKCLQPHQCFKWYRAGKLLQPNYIYIGMAIINYRISWRKKKTNSPQKIFEIKLWSNLVPN